MGAHVPVTIEAHEFAARDFIAGDVALDFVNTVSGRDERPRDWLDSYSRLLDWTMRVQLLPEKNLKALVKRASTEPAMATRALSRAKALREAMFDVVTAIVARATPSAGSLNLVREYWIAGAEAHELRFESGRVVAGLRSDVGDLDLIAGMLAYRLVEQVLHQPVDRLRKCDGQNCSWVFIDSSKAGRRRWCDMAVCGNTAKSRRYYARSRGGHTA
jgi:predicted RNA-binding Zn ribbon-like protein